MSKDTPGAPAEAAAIELDKIFDLFRDARAKGNINPNDLLAAATSEKKVKLLAKEMGLDNMVHVRLNFPPFQHFKINDKNSLVCVGKSHWIGDLKTGDFSKDHGQITNKLANMYLKLCEKYSLRFNWRGYTYVDEMRGAAILQLTYVGLRFNEAKSQNPFAYYTAAITNSFCRVLNTEKRVQNIRDDILESNGLNPSFTRQHSLDSEREKRRNIG